MKMLSVYECFTVLFKKKLSFFYFEIDPEESESNQVKKIESNVSDGSPPKPSKCPSVLWTATQRF